MYRLNRELLETEVRSLSIFFPPRFRGVAHRLPGKRKVYPRPRRAPLRRAKFYRTVRRNYMSKNVIKSWWNREKRAVKKNRWHIRGCCRLIPITDGDSIPSTSDLLRNLRLIKIVDSSMQLTVTQWKLTSSFSKASGSLQLYFFENITPKTVTDVLSCVISKIVFWYLHWNKQASKQANSYITGFEKPYPAHSSFEAAARYCDGRIERPVERGEKRSGASARTDVHFMGRHVVSVQWCKVWFFPGNFGLFNRDPISRSARPAGFELRQRPRLHLLLPLPAQFSHWSLFSTSGSSLFRFFSRCMYASFHHYVPFIIFVLLGAALFRLILFSFFDKASLSS